ncbi:MAG: hypothetical protein K6G80_07880 [Treponema sp.]|nr:hypothetical protein [Treponema sp.]
MNILSFYAKPGAACMAALFFLGTPQGYAEGSAGGSGISLTAENAAPAVTSISPSSLCPSLTAGFQYAEWKTAAACTLPLPDNAAETDTATGTVSTGIKLVCTSADFRWYESFSDSSLSDASPPERDSARYGAKVTFFSKSIPVSLLSGSLSFARSLSCLKNPAPASTISPLAKSFTALHGLGASLPTLSASRQPLAAVLTANIQSKAAPVFAECGLQEDKTAFASVHGTLFPCPYVKAGYSLTAGRFFLEDSTTISAAGAGFSPGWYNAAIAESTMSIPLLKLCLQGAVHQTPYDTHAVWLYGKIRTGWQSVLLDAHGFMIPTTAENPQAAPVIGGSSTVCRVRKQAGLRTQVQLLTAGNAAIHGGVQLIWQEKVTSTKYADVFSTEKAGAALAFESPGLTVKSSVSALYIHTEGAFHTVSSIPNQYYDAACTGTVTREAVKASLSLDAKHYPRQELSSTSVTKDILTAKLSVSPGKSRMVTARAGVTATWKAKERTAGQLDAAVIVKHLCGRLRTAVSCALSLPF